MLGKQAISIRIAGILVLTATLLGQSQSVSAQGIVGPLLAVWNPSACDRLLPGSLVMRGVALDPGGIERQRCGPSISVPR